MMAFELCSRKGCTLSKLEIRKRCADGVVEWPDSLVSSY